MERQKEITIKLNTTTYKELKQTALALKNVNIFGTKYKTIEDEEIAGLISLALKQKEFIETLKELKEKAEQNVNHK